jgi:hypothetical protein
MQYSVQLVFETTETIVKVFVVSYGGRGRRQWTRFKISCHATPNQDTVVVSGYDGQYWPVDSRSRLS